MKSDKDLLELCMELYNDKNDNETVSKNVTRKQWALFKILLKKFRDSLVSNKGKNNGILRIRLESPFWKDPDEGYKLLKELIDNNQFDSFAQEYCMYLGNVCQDGSDTHPDFFEIIWDYKNYFEQLGVYTLEGNQSLSSSLSEYKKLPIAYQEEIRKSFIDNVQKVKNEYLHDVAESTCEELGHDFTKWKEFSWTSDEVYWDAGPKGYIEVTHHRWTRKCLRCGFFEKTEIEPQEVYEERKERARNTRIKELKKELRILEEKKS